MSFEVRGTDKAIPAQLELRTESEVALRSFSGAGHNFSMYYVYILRDSTGRIYTGYSNDLKKRLQYHQGHSVNTTKNYSDPTLIWYCAFKNKQRALAFEKYLKAGSGHAFAKKHLTP